MTLQDLATAAPAPSAAPGPPRQRTAPGSSAGADDLDPAGAAVRVRPLLPADHRWVADLHVRELPHGLFPALGRRFVRRWHRAHVASPFGTAYVALRDGEPLGFLLGSVDRRAHVSWVVRNRRLRLGAAGLAALALRPRVAATFLRTRAGRYARRLLGRPAPVAPASAAPTTTPGAPPALTQPSGPVAVLEAVVVVPDHRVQGVGSELVAAFLADARATGAAVVELVTKDGDEGAAGFYERGGWTQVGSHTYRDGDRVLRFRTDLA